MKEHYSLIGSKYEGKVSKHSELVKDLINKYEKELAMKDTKILKEQCKRKLSDKNVENLSQKIEIMKLKAKLKK